MTEYNNNNINKSQINFFNKSQIVLKRNGT
jgi:hypothetical protein